MRVSFREVLGRAADPDRPLIDLDRELRTVLGSPERGGEGESDDQQEPANSGAGRVRGSSHGLLVDGVLDDRSEGAAARLWPSRLGGGRSATIEAGVGPDHAIAGVLVRSEVHDEPELFGPRNGQGQADRRGVGAEVRIGI